MKTIKTTIKIFFSIILLCNTALALDMYDDLTANGSPNNGHNPSRAYRNGAITLHDNVFIARSLLSEIGRVGAVTTQLNYYNAMSIKQQNFYQEQAKNATHDFDLQAINNRIKLDIIEFKSVKNNSEKR